MAVLRYLLQVGPQTILILGATAQQLKQQQDLRLILILLVLPTKMAVHQHLQLL